MTDSISKDDDLGNERKRFQLLNTLLKVKAHTERRHTIQDNLLFPTKLHNGLAVGFLRLLLYRLNVRYSLNSRSFYTVLLYYVNFITFQRLGSPSFHLTSLDFLHKLSSNTTTTT